MPQAPHPPKKPKLPEATWRGSARIGLRKVVKWQPLVCRDSNRVIANPDFALSGPDRIAVSPTTTKEVCVGGGNIMRFCRGVG